MAALEGRRYRRMLEPFGGSAAMTLAAAEAGVADRFVLGDGYGPIAALWRQALTEPAALADAYAAIWQAQRSDPAAHYYAERELYWSDPEPARLLYLLARAVKNAPRWSSDGRFNQSPDHRRRGVHPDKVRAAAHAVADLLAGRCEVREGDFAAQLADAGSGDVVYLDPPYVGTSTGRDRRYASGLDSERLAAEVASLRARGAAVLISYDGETGGRSYAPPLPESLRLERRLLDAGRSSQATLLGRDERTLEALYLGL
ncbi:MAG: DNA adenine methylase [Deltaproteobacteria bacterium]|nr:DNA adenine methylase [Deltaproteobacteria bacterium]